MPDKNAITLVIEGLPQDDGRVRFSTFITELQSLSTTIARLDKEAHGGQAGSQLRIAELSYNSPIRVVLEAHPNKGFPYAGQLLIESLERTAAAISGDGDLLSIDAEILEDIRSLARPVGKQLSAATLLFNGTQLSLNQRVIDRVDSALAVADECEGMVQGMLEQINIHHGANTFHIYPEIGPHKVTCNFSSRLYDDAVSSVGRKVEVFGTMKYRARASFPHQIIVSSIDIFPLEEDIPEWEDIRGRAPDATGDLSSEAFVRELRSGWR